MEWPFAFKAIPQRTGGARGSNVHIIVVLDISGSMGSALPAYLEGIREMFTPPEACADTEACKYFFSFITFSDFANVMVDIDPISIEMLRGSTNIQDACAKLNSVINSGEIPSKRMIVFISDGADDRSSTIVDRINRQGFANTKDCVTVVVCVAVGRGFPTHLFNLAIKKGYHSGDANLSLIYQLQAWQDRGEILSVLKIVTEFVYSYESTAEIGVEAKMPSFNRRTRLRAFPKIAEKLYNFAFSKCYEAQTRRELNQILGRMKGRFMKMRKYALLKEEEDCSRAMEAAADERGARLASARLAVLRRERTLTSTAIFDCVAKLNELIGEVSKGVTFRQMPDAQLQAVQAFGCNIGRFHEKSRNIKGRRVDMDECFASLKKYLDGYTPEIAERDEENSDGYLSTKDVVEDLKAIPWDDVTDTIASVAELMTTVGFPGNLFMATMYPQTQINPWLVDIENMPRVFTKTNTSDLARMGGEYDGTQGGEFPHERANYLYLTAVQGYDVSGFEFGKMINSVLLTKSPELKVPDSHLAGTAAVLVYFLTSPYRKQEWFQLRFEEFTKTYKVLYCGSRGHAWRRYCLDMESDDFREFCLSTCSSGNKKCEHFTKPVLALFDLALRGVRLSAERLLEIKIAILAELVGRTTRPEDTFCSMIEFTPKKTVREVFHALELDATFAMSYTEHEAVSNALEDATAKLKVGNELCGIESYVRPTTIDAKSFGVDATKISDAINSIFPGVLPDELDVELVQRILYHGRTFKESKDRNMNAIEEVDWEAIEAALEERNIHSILRQLPELIKEEYKAMMLATHIKTTPIPPIILDLYKERTGNDMGARLKINWKTGMSPLACVCVHCPHAFCIGKNAEKVAQDGTAVASDLLLQHIMGSPSFITGYSKAVSSKAPCEETTQQIADFISSGEHLFLSCEEMDRKLRERNKETIEQVYIGERGFVGAVEQSRMFYETFFEKPKTIAEAAEFEELYAIYKAKFDSALVLDRVHENQRETAAGGTSIFGALTHRIFGF